MAFTVRNNPSAIRSLVELNRNIKNQSKSQKKLATGMKINGAGDDASAYAISERMKVHLRALNQDVDNVRNGRDMLKVAAGGIDNIVEELRNLKELAIKSANDSNTNRDRATIQKEFEQKMANINDIAAGTNYNGKLLLNGTFAGPKTASATSTGEEVADLAEAGTIGAANSGTYTISSNGLYQLESGFTGTIKIASGVSQVELVGAGSALSDVYISSSSSNLKLILKDYDVNITQPVYGDGSSIIRFSGSGNQLILKGNNSLTDTYSYASTEEAVINMGDGLTISNGDADGQGTLNINYLQSYGAAIGTGYEGLTSGDINILGGNINIYAAGAPLGAAIGSGQSGSVGNISISGGKISITEPNGDFRPYRDGAGIGAGSRGTVGNIHISKSELDIMSGWGAGIGSGEGWGNTSTAGDIFIDNSIITVKTRYGAGVGTGRSTSGYQSIAGNITVNNSIINFTTSNYAEDVGRGHEGTVGSVTVNPGEPDLSKPAQQSEQSTEGNPLVIHHGTKANQALHCYINDMHTDAMGLSGTTVVTREAAQWSLSDDSIDPPRIGAIDQAINYALDEATTVGAYISRLETTEENLVISSENAQASESTIRDADMAKAVVEFTKNNVLVQATQSMLAQANQNSSNVLALLQ